MFNDQAGAQKNESKLPAADAFLNLKLVDGNGKEHSIQSGCALRIKNKVDRAMIDHARSNPDQIFSLVGSVHIVEADDGIELDLGL